MPTALPPLRHRVPLVEGDYPAWAGRGVLRSARRPLASRGVASVPGHADRAFDRGRGDVGFVVGVAGGHVRSVGGSREGYVVGGGPPGG